MIVFIYYKPRMRFKRNYNGSSANRFDPVKRVANVGPGDYNPKVPEMGKDVHLKF